jgi:protein TonB
VAPAPAALLPKEVAADPAAEKLPVAKPAEPQPQEVPRETVEPPPAPQVAAVPPVPEAPDVRSALRRGAPGTGGAGGRGEGRAGIEGEPIPLDSKDPKYSDYLDRVRRMIKEKWAYPCVRDQASGRCDYKSTSLVIEFGILKDGRVPFVIVRSQSDYDIYDAYAVNAIKLASPFPPVPDSLTGGKQGIPILASFTYIVESSLTNLLR